MAVEMVAAEDGSKRSRVVGPCLTAQICDGGARVR